MKYLVRKDDTILGVFEYESIEAAKAELGDIYPDSKIDLKKVITLDNGCEVVVPNYLSPTSIDKAYSDPNEFFNMYISVTPQPRFPQTYQMMFGSAFDAFAKSYLVEAVLGKTPDEFKLDTILKSQCEAQYWDKDNKDYKSEFDAYYWGEYLFNAYKTSGALQDLMIELKEAAHVDFEFTVTNEIKIKEDENGLVLLGKPDIYFKTKNHSQVIIDWKCNGIYGKNPTSPKQQYMRVRDGWTTDVEAHSKSHLTRHKDVFPCLHKGITINKSCSFEAIDKTWAAQLCSYGWLMGEPIGSDFVLGIDQLVGSPKGYMRPLIRVASHRAIVSDKWQKEFYILAKNLWDKLQEGHVFISVDKEQSDEMVAEMYAIYGKHEKGSKEEWLAKSLRVPKYGHNK